VNDKAKRILARAAELLRAGWVQEEFATDANGDTVSFDAPQATCFCTLGAIHRAGHDLRLGLNERTEARIALGAMLATGDLIGWNDTPGRTQAEVVTAFERAAY
jgi:hypothetical protein